MQQRRVDWSSAEVDSVGTLTVEISGEADDVWMEALIRTLDWMESETHGGSWEHIDYAPSTFRVEGVSEDSVDLLRKFLDDAVRHANEAAAHDRAAAEPEGRSADIGPEAARRMTNQFRRGDAA
jgi:hypothetical protein